MIVQIEKSKTRIAIIQQIPKKFFREIESATSFGDHLFPSWVEIFSDKYAIRSKFDAVYDAYKAISGKPDRDRIIQAFRDTNEIVRLCDNDPAVQMFELKNLHSTIQTPLLKLFLYLYETAINAEPFQTYVRDDVASAIGRFRSKNRITVCPFCGLESFNILTGEARPSLDHWLHKSSFPMAAVNFNNLVPIGDKCNQSPVKGEKNILVDHARRRVKAFYPYGIHSGTTTSFQYTREPAVPSDEGDWRFHLAPNNSGDADIFNSWKNVFNIEVRYNNFFRTTVFSMWRDRFKGFIEASSLSHARTIDELKDRLRVWKGNFVVNYEVGAMAYRNFIDYLINSASEAYLYGIGKSLNKDFIDPWD